MSCPFWFVLEFASDRQIVVFPLNSSCANVSRYKAESESDEGGGEEEDELEVSLALSSGSPVVSFSNLASDSHILTGHILRKRG